MSTVSFFTIENERNVVNKLSLPDDCIKRKFVTITDSSKDGSGEYIISLHYNVDQIPLLFSVNSPYTQDEVRQILTIRGILYDVKKDEIVCSSFSYTYTIPVSSVPLDENLQIPTNVVFVTPENGKYFECYGGAIYRTYNHNDKSRGCTHRRMNADNSHFGRSDNFGEIFLKNQGVFRSLDEIYNNFLSEDVSYDLSEDGDVHIFLLNDANLLIDSREQHSEDKIIYLGSLSVKDPNRKCDLKPAIEELNMHTDKPIYFPKELTYEEVNQRLKGNLSCELNIDFNQPIELINKYLSSIGTKALSLFSDSRKVIYQTEYGVFTLVSSPVLFRQKMMEGQVNVTKLFADCIANFYHNKKVMVPYGFSFESLKDIMTRVKNNQTYDLSNYELISDKPELIVLTNLVFCVPLHLIDECFDAYTSFGLTLKNACEFFIKNKEKISLLIKNKNLEAFEGMYSSSSKMKNYLISNFNKCFDKRKEIDSGTKPHWPHLVIDFYHSLYSKIAQDKNNETKVSNLLTNAAIVCLVVNATGDCLYAMMNFERKHNKTMEAFSKSTSR